MGDHLGSPSTSSQQSGTHADKLRLIAEVEELTRRQTAAEASRREALASTAAAHRETDLAQDLLHTSLKRISDLDDNIYNARALLSTKREALDLEKAKLLQVNSRKNSPPSVLWAFSTNFLTFLNCFSFPGRKLGQKMN